MQVNNFFDIILLLGSALSMLMAIFLWASSAKLQSTRVLSIMNFVWSYVAFMYAVQSLAFFLEYPHVYGISSVLPLSLFPLMYIYIRSYLVDDLSSIKKILPHFIPMIIYFAVISPYYFQSGEIKAEIIRTESFPDYFYTANTIFDIVIVIQGIYYSTLSMKLIHKNFYFTSEKFSDENRNIYYWLNFFVLSYVALWAMGAINAVLELLNFVVPFSLFNIFYMGLTLLTLGIGFFTIKYPEIIYHYISSDEDNSISSSSESQKETEKLDADKKTKKELDHLVIEESKEDLSSVSHTEVQVIIDYLEKDKAYLKNNLSLQDMSDAIAMPKHKISATLKTELGKNFYELLNEYRTKEAIKLFNDGKHTSFTLTYIAEMAGFNSRATFNRIFKKITNQTPTEYIQGLYARNEKKAN
jgi:AraC-like DNA-binding protein